MSFIFDALKRAEEERRQGGAPPLETVLQGGPATGRRRWPWMVVSVGLGANAAVLGGWLWARNPGPMLTGPSTPVAGTDSVRPAPETSVKRPRPAVSPVSAPSREAPPVPTLEPKAPVPESPVRVEPEFSPPAPETVSVRPVEPAATVPKPPPPSAPTRDPEPTPARTAQTPVVPTPPLPLEDLPPAVQTRLGKIRLDGHVYRDDPKKRFVFIDNHVYHGGDTIGVDGPKIEVITPKGVVLDYGGGRAILTVRGEGP